MNEATSLETTPLEETIVKKKLLVAGSALFVIAMFASLGIAVNRGDRGPGHGRGMKGGGPPSIGRMVQHMAGELALTDAQKASIEQIVTENRAADGAGHEADRALMEQLKLQGTDGTFDEAAVRSIAAQLANRHTEQIVARERTKAQIFGVLTADQRAKLIEKLEKGGPHGKRGGKPPIQ